MIWVSIEKWHYKHILDVNSLLNKLLNNLFKKTSKCQSSSNQKYLRNNSSLSKRLKIRKNNKEKIKELKAVKVEKEEDSDLNFKTLI